MVAGYLMEFEKGGSSDEQSSPGAGAPLRPRRRIGDDREV